MPLIKGQTYTWRQVLKEAGADGSPPYYLLHAGRKIVASCLTPDLNPDAPAVILAGDTAPRREYADLFCEQLGPIPVCMKAGERWLCCGQFKLQRASTEPAELQEHAARAKRTDVYKILFLEEVAPPEPVPAPEVVPAPEQVAAPEPAPAPEPSASNLQSE